MKQVGNHFYQKKKKAFNYQAQLLGRRRGLPHGSYQLLPVEMLSTANQYVPATPAGPPPNVSLIQSVLLPQRMVGSLSLQQA